MCVIFALRKRSEHTLLTFSSAKVSKKVNKSNTIFLTHEPEELYKRTEKTRRRRTWRR